ncbi:MAG TPA: CocE/NonD family hydrolase [Pseudonocardiaceae bacterium]|jgi:hypothetical protein|nr:CocE/NonD family hydrolase [Pseudonocardiaceae bacterium]
MAGTRDVVYSLLGSVLSRAWHLPRKRNRVTIDRDVRVPMRDGVTLLADHYAPVTDVARPTVLVRSPYGRGVQFAMMVALPYAERGYHVLLQSVRGTFGSAGTFRPGVDEARDGQDTVAWLREQPWFDGRLATAGPSYLAFTQWALAMDPPPELRAMVVHIGTHDLAAAGSGQGPFQLYNTLMWTELMSHQEGLGLVRGVVRLNRTERRLAPALARLPLRTTQDGMGGKGAPWYDDWLTHHGDLAHAYWEGYRADEALRRVSVPTLLVGGFHDFFVDQTLTQYHALRERGVDVGLTLGPWTHLTLDQGVALGESLAWLDEHVAGDGRPARRQPVRVWLGGARQWRELAEWPPDTEPVTWYLAPKGALRSREPAGLDVPPSTFRYDPDHPTPSIGGRLMAASGGSQDNSELERRKDVLTFTTARLREHVDVLGTPVAELSVESDNPYADLFVRLCDVDEQGRSFNLTDQIVRVTDDKLRRIRIPLVDMAHRFLPGHSIRLQVSGGAHPRFARNLGVEGHQADGVATRPTRHWVYHSVAHPSTLTLPTE